MRTLAIAAALGGFFLLARRRGSQPIPSRPLSSREYQDRLANRLESALSYGNKPMWEEASEECRKVGREDLPEHMRKKRPEWAAQLDRA